MFESLEENSTINAANNLFKMIVNSLQHLKTSIFCRNKDYYTTRLKNKTNKTKQKKILEVIITFMYSSEA